MSTLPNQQKLVREAFRYSVPVLLGYLTIGIAFGLILTDAGYPIWLALIMSFIIYAGAAQYLAVGLFAAGASLWEIALVTLVVNARHLAYGFSLLKRFEDTGPYKAYLVFSLTDETFALHSALPEQFWLRPSQERGRFMFFVALMDQSYWITGSLIGAIAGALLPFKLNGLDFALTALFTILMLEQYWRLKQLSPFLIAAASSTAAVFLLPERAALLVALAVSLAATAFWDRTASKRVGSC